MDATLHLNDSTDRRLDHVDLTKRGCDLRVVDELPVRGEAHTGAVAFNELRIRTNQAVDGDRDSGRLSGSNSSG